MKKTGEKVSNESLGFKGKYRYSEKKITGFTTLQQRKKEEKRRISILVGVKGKTKQKKG